MPTETGPTGTTEIGPTETESTSAEDLGASELSAALPTVAHEIEVFVATSGWDQPPQLFGLVPTQQLLSAEPSLAEQLDPAAPLTPIAQDSLPADDLGEALAQIAWPEQVVGCALVQEIVVLPPDAEEELPRDEEQARQVAADHPRRQEARLAAAVLREGGETCVMRLRAAAADSADERGAGDDVATHQDSDEIIQDAALAPNLINALQGTFS